MAKGGTPEKRLRCNYWLMGAAFGAMVSHLLEIIFMLVTFIDILSSDIVPVIFIL